MRNQSIFAAGLLFASLLFTYGCSPTQAKPDTNETKPATETFVLKKGLISDELRLPGELVAFRQVDLYGKVNSFVKELKVDIGSEVSEGQLLAILEAPELSLQLLASESRFVSQEALYKASKANYDRMLETSKIAGTISQNDLDQALAKMNSDKAQLDMAKATQDEVKIMQGYLEIRAPFAGIITARNVNMGAYVGPSGKGSEFPIFTLQEQKQLRLVVSIPESYTGLLRQNDEISFTVRSQPNRTYKAQAKRLAGALDTRLRSERVEMDVTNADKSLLPGMIAEVYISIGRKDSTLVIPQSALVNSYEGTFVIGVVNNKTRRIGVTKGRETKDEVEIFGELQPGETLVKKAGEELRDGTTIH